jgi:predicted ester cyclase
LGNISLIRKLHDIWNTGVVQAVDDVYDPDFVAYWPPSSEVPIRRVFDGIRFGVTRIRTAFSDWHEEVVDVFGSGDRVASRYISRGTHSGRYWGTEPTGRKVEHEISIFECRNDLVTIQWRLIDELARLQQLGASDAQLRQALKLQP